MFKDVEELRKLIREGKSNEEIINNQLKYLNSDEYKKNKLKTEKEDGSDIITFHEGFIDSNMSVSFSGGMLFDILYTFDDNSIYETIIDLIRDNMDKKGFSINHMMRIIREYFEVNDNSKYKKLYDMFKEVCPSDPYFGRRTLPYILMNYNYSNFDGDITEFGKAYLYNILYNETHKERYRELSEKYIESIGFDEMDEAADIYIPISTIKGAGIAACTEYAILEQNILSFLGYDVYMLGGNLKMQNNRVEAHTFNAIKNNENDYEIIDTAQVVRQKIDNISSVEDLKNLSNVKAINGFKEEIYYSSSKRKKNYFY